MRVTCKAPTVAVMAAACMVVACSRAHEVPPELPELASPIPPPPPPAAKPVVDTIELTLLDADGNELSQPGNALTRLEAGQDFQGHLDYRLSPDSVPVSRVTLRLGLYINDNFVSARSKTMKPVQDSSGAWHVDAPLRAAPDTGTYYLRCEMFTESHDWHVVQESVVRIDETTE